jgi:hypothetical protein
MIISVLLLPIYIIVVSWFAFELGLSATFVGIDSTELQAGGAVFQLFFFSVELPQALSFALVLAGSFIAILAFQLTDVPALINLMILTPIIAAVTYIFARLARGGG